MRRPSAVWVVICRQYIQLQAYHGLVADPTPEIPDNGT